MQPGVSQEEMLLLGYARHSIVATGCADAIETMEPVVKVSILPKQQ